MDNLKDFQKQFPCPKGATEAGAIKKINSSEATFILDDSRGKRLFKNPQTVQILDEAMKLGVSLFILMIAFALLD